MALLRFLRLLALVVWVGSLACLFLIVAPSLIAVLPSQHEVGLVVGRSLATLHWAGMAAGVVFLAASLAVGRSRASNGLVIAMLALTAILQFGILRRMEQMRAAVPGGDMAALSTSNPERAAFDRMHGLSVRLESGVLLLGLVAVFLVSREGIVQAAQAKRKTA